MFKADTNEVAQHSDMLPLFSNERADCAAWKCEPYGRRQADQQDANQQRIRKGNLLTAGLFASLYLTVLALLQAQGQLAHGTLGAVAAAVALVMLILSGIFVSRLNQKVREKDLAVLFAVCSFTIMLGTLYAAPASGVAYTPFVFVVVAYGMFRLTRRCMLTLSATAIVGYAGVIVLLHMNGPQPETIGTALVDLLVLTITLPAFAMLTGRVGRLHSALHKAGMRIRNMEEDARHDQLLGCYNRHYMIAVLERQKRLADKYGQPLCLAVLDLDHFKRINDEVGHLIGDEVLRTFTRIAQDSMRQEDVFGRYRGEEFMLILPQTQLLAALNTAERIREQAESYGWQGTLQSPVTVSIGLTQYIPGESVLDLFSRSDSAMYLAKRGGRNQVVVEEPRIEL